jgi:hypothetical protein
MHTHRQFVLALPLDVGIARRTPHTAADHFASAYRLGQRVHHASNTEHLDRNYGGVLIIWDRLFGTFAGERAQTPIRYGLTHPIGG